EGQPHHQVDSRAHHRAHSDREWRSPDRDSAECAWRDLAERQPVSIRPEIPAQGHFAGGKGRDLYRGRREADSQGDGREVWRRSEAWNRIRSRDLKIAERQDSSNRAGAGADTMRAFDGDSLRRVAVFKSAEGKYPTAAPYHPSDQYPEYPF